MSDAGGNALKSMSDKIVKEKSRTFFSNLSVVICFYGKLKVGQFGLQTGFTGEWL